MFPNLIHRTGEGRRFGAGLHFLEPAMPVMPRRDVSIQRRRDRLQRLRRGLLRVRLRLHRVRGMRGRLLRGLESEHRVFRLPRRDLRQRTGQFYLHAVSRRRWLFPRIQRHRVCRVRRLWRRAVDGARVHTGVRYGVRRVRGLRFGGVPGRRMRAGGAGGTGWTRF